MAPVSVNRRDKLILELFNLFENKPISYEQFSKVMRKLIGSDRRTISKYWSDLIEDDYLIKMSDKLARLHPEIIKFDGQVGPEGVTPVKELLEALR